MTKDDVRHVASLAKLAFDDSEAGAMLEDMRSILEYVARLEKLENLGADTPAKGASGGRPDSVNPGLSPGQALAAAPEEHNGHFRVPRVLKEASS